MKFFDKNIIKVVNMYIICWCDEKDEHHDIAYEYQQHKIKPRPKIHISEYKKNEIKASRNWIGLDLNDRATIIVLQCSPNHYNPLSLPITSEYIVDKETSFLPFEIVKQSFCTV